MTPIEAVSAVLQVAGTRGMRLDDIVHSVVTKLGREIPEPYVRALLANARWDPETRRWSTGSLGADLDAA